MQLINWHKHLSCGKVWVQVLKSIRKQNKLSLPAALSINCFSIFFDLYLSVSLNIFQFLQNTMLILVLLQLPQVPDFIDDYGRVAKLGPINACHSSSVLIGLKRSLQGSKIIYCTCTIITRSFSKQSITCT